MFNVSCCKYHICTFSEPFPASYEELCHHARLVEKLGDLDSGRGKRWVLAVALPGQWPLVLVDQRHSPAEGGFYPGALVVPETNLLFLGAGERLLAYDLAAPRRLWEDKAYCGFWDWQRHGDAVLMSAELELAAWDVGGKKLWTTFVEPPWTYTVSGDVVHLDVMGTQSAFPLSSGPR